MPIERFMVMNDAIKQMKKNIHEMRNEALTIQQHKAIDRMEKALLCYKQSARIELDKRVQTMNDLQRGEHRQIGLIVYNEILR